MMDPQHVKMQYEKQDSIERQFAVRMASELLMDEQVRAKSEVTIPFTSIKELADEIVEYIKNKPLKGKNLLGGK